MLTFSFVITFGFIFECSVNEIIRAPLMILSAGKGAVKISNQQLYNFSIDNRSTNSFNYLGNLTSSYYPPN